MSLISNVKLRGGYQPRRGMPGLPTLIEPAPALPAPGAVTPVPAVPPGKDMPTSEFGFLYNEINTRANNGPGTLDSGTLSWNVSIPITANPSAASETLSWTLTQTQFTNSGARGVRFDRSASENSAHSILLSLGGVNCWETVAMDFDITTLPCPDLVLAYSHQTGAPGDNLRMSQRTLVNGGVKTILGGEAIGSPAAEACAFTVVAPTGASTPVGGVAVRVFNSANGFQIGQRSGGSDQALISFSQKVTAGFDYTGAQDNILRLIDTNAGHTTPSAGNKNRLAVTFPNTIQGAIGLNTASPGGLLDVRGEVAAGATVVTNRYFIGARTDGGAPNRAFVMAQLTSTAGTDNLLLLSGDTDPAATIAAPSINSTTSHGSGWWFDGVNNVSHLFATPNGTNQAISKCVSWAQAAGSPLVGFYGTAPAAKPSISGSRGGNAALASLLTGLASLGLITDGSS